MIYLTLQVSESYVLLVIKLAIELIVSALISAICSINKGQLHIDTGTLQIFNGTLTEITCSAAEPAYRLVDQERVYDSYAQLPELFDIQARLSPTRNNVTLYINGTNRSNNVTVMCGNVDISLGTSLSNVLFTLILEFVGKFSNKT